jgi:hypothetical protein
MSEPDLPESFHRYIELLAETNRIVESADRAGLLMMTLRKLRSTYPSIVPEQEEEARERFRDKVRKEVHRRSIDGIEKPVYWQGEQTATEIQYSDRLLELYAKAHCSEFREKSNLDLKVTGGVLVIPNPPAQSEEEWAASE